MIVEEKYGTTAKGSDVYKYKISQGGTEVEVITYGATVVSLKRPDYCGVMRDIVLGYSSLKEYEKNDGYLGATIGRTCNRIDYGRFVLENKVYDLRRNDRTSHLHGGAEGFDKKVWRVDSVWDNGVAMMLKSLDGDENYPGKLNASAMFYLSDDGSFNIVYTGESDKTTLCDMTNHMYFNMDGENTGSVDTNLIRIYAHTFTPVNERMVPEGKVRAVEETPFDFMVFKELSRDIDKKDEQLIIGGGYDHNYVADKPSGKIGALAEAIGKNSHIRMRMESNADCIQFYSGNMLSGVEGKSGVRYGKRSGFCFEPQVCPNSINIEGFLAPVLAKGSVYRKRITYKFSIEKILIV